MNTKLEDCKYGLLYDNTIVKIYDWSSSYDIYDRGSQEIYFNYTFWYRLKTKFNKKNAWAYRKDFISFSNSKRKLRKLIY